MSANHTNTARRSRTSAPQRKRSEAARNDKKPTDRSRSRIANPAASKARKSAVDPRLGNRLSKLIEVDITFIENDSFVGRRENHETLSSLVEQIELGTDELGKNFSASMPAHLARMCATPLLDPEQEQELFRRFNFCKYRANAIRARIAKTKPDAKKMDEVADYLRRANQIRNYLIQANTRLVMSIARRFADQRNAFDDLLSTGLSSLMHSVEKFDYSRGYRFSTYATCAVRRDLYRMVMSKKKDHQRFSTGTGEYLDGCVGGDATEGELTESSWNHLSKSLREMIELLDDREKFIVTCRFGLDESGKKSSYSRLGERLGISKERVRQLANRALDKLREAAPEYRIDGLLS